MSYAYEMDRPLAAKAVESERAAFIRRTYLHLAGAILAFVTIEFQIFQLFSGQQMEQFMRSVFVSPISGLILIARSKDSTAAFGSSRWICTQPVMMRTCAELGLSLFARMSVANAISYS